MSTNQVRVIIPRTHTDALARRLQPDTASKSVSMYRTVTSYMLSYGICRSHVDSFTRGECNLVWIFFTSQSTLIRVSKIMLNLEIVCDTLNRIFGVVLSAVEVADGRRTAWRLTWRTAQRTAW
jgi:hypothetical protein